MRDTVQSILDRNLGERSKPLAELNLNQDSRDAAAIRCTLTATELNILVAASALGIEPEPGRAVTLPPLAPLSRPVPVA